MKKDSYQTVSPKNRLIQPTERHQKYLTNLAHIREKPYILIPKGKRMAQIPIFDEKDEELKRYFSISETAEMFKISKSQIRFWEKEFDLLKPHKNSKGERRFTRQNIEQLKTIYTLVKERGFTLEGAKKELKRRKNAGKEKLVYIEKLTSLRNFLEDMKEQL